MMNVFLWVVQFLLAMHTVMGALWKFANAEQTVPALSAIPHGAWLAMGVMELLFSAALIVPAVNRRFAFLAPVAAIGIALEMLLFSGLHLVSGAGSRGELIYWLVVAGICTFVAYGRAVLRPH